MRRTCSLLVLLLMVMSWTSTEARNDLGGPFVLINQNGSVVTDHNFHGKPVLLYFGFTSCPDICPMDLAKLGSVTRSLAANHAVQVTPVFVTIDPERDTPDRLRAYVTYFHQDMVGLTGSNAAIASMADHYAVYYKRVPLDDSYTMDHSTFVFLLDQNGSYLDHYGSKVPAADIVKRIVAKLN